MKLKYSISALLAMVILVGTAQAQELPAVFEDDGFFAPQPQKAPWLLDWGATVSPAGVFDSTAGELGLVAALSGNVWLRLSLPGLWQFYGRLRDSALLEVLPWPAAGLELVNLWELNAAYLQLTDPEVGLSLAIGRKPFLLGSGLVLSGTGDGLEVQLSNPLFNLKAFGFYTGLLDPGFSTYGMHAWDDENGARRYIGGYSVGTGFSGHEISLLGMYQGDFGLSPEDLYTSWYTGLQAKGMLLGGDYLVEWYLEEGYSPSASTSGAIDAFGGTVRYQRVFGIPTSPGITVQYSLASGDLDRTIADGSVGNTVGIDTAFQAFGQLNSGSVFRPYFSNVHVGQAGFSWRPLEEAGYRLRDSSIGLRYFYYAKYALTGVVNVDEGALPSYDLGHGIDVVLRWSPYNDLSTFINAGLFLPGAAFPAGEALRYAVSGGMSLSF
jgi:hypothetical protein